MIARYLRHVDRLWLYAHSSIQLSGFVIGFSGIITGLILNDRIDINVAKHKAIGLIIITLGCLQVCAFFFLYFVCYNDMTLMTLLNYKIPRVIFDNKYKKGI